MNKLVIVLLSFLIISCQGKKQKITPITSSITESIYASGLIKSENQYQAFATISGTIQDIFVADGDTIKKGQPLLTIANAVQRLSKENAALQAAFSAVESNNDKVREAQLAVELSEYKMKTDSTLYFRQKALWNQQVGTKFELEQRALAYENSKTNYYSSVLKFNDLQRQINFLSKQSKTNFEISKQQESEFILKSEMDGIVYSMIKSKGDLVTPQIPLAVIGDAKHFILEMQVDEYDIFKIKKGLTVLVTLDSYKGKVFEARVTKTEPVMNTRSKTFLVEAEFTESPELLFPNISFEANIILQKKENALLIPRDYLKNDSTVLLTDGKEVHIVTGLKDYQKIEVLSGIDKNTELQKPE